jgi:hypothetical protein
MSGLNISVSVVNLFLGEFYLLIYIGCEFCIDLNCSFVS